MVDISDNALVTVSSSDSSSAIPGGATTLQLLCALNRCVIFEMSLPAGLTLLRGPKIASKLIFAWSLSASTLIEFRQSTVG